MYDMYPWGDPADSASAEHRNAEPRNAEPRHVSAEPRRVQVPGPRRVPADEPAAAIWAVQVSLDRRDNGGDALVAARQPGASQPGASQPTASRTRQ